jgi:hypothetical protein
MQWIQRLLRLFVVVCASLIVQLPALAQGDPVMVGAGDIGGCTTKGAEATAKLLDRIGGLVFTLGDDSQDEGTEKQYQECYGPTWGVLMLTLRADSYSWNFVPVEGGKFTDSGSAPCVNLK